MKFPRVLLVDMSRINAADAHNNGLLLRTLFRSWPRDNLAQIYSSGDNGDKGFFGDYYQLGPQDRWLGRIFYRLKTSARQDSARGSSAKSSGTTVPGQAASVGSLVERLFVHSGIYELIFRPRVSRKMLAWVREFQPDVILAQGYCLTFTWLPVMLKKETGARLAFLTTDDWPTYLYSEEPGESRLIAGFMKSVVTKATKELMSAVDVPFAFGQPMADEYSLRYGKSFTTISHSDDPDRFTGAIPLRFHPPGILTILVVGELGKFRWPLVLDANECCRLLNGQGIRARIAVLSYDIDPEGARALARASYVDLSKDPGNDLLPRYLKGADVLLLVEAFDQGRASAIHLSVSSKAHLFMFSGRPIIVYAHPDTGLSKYASAYRWGHVVAERDVNALLEAIRSVLKDPNEARVLVSCADQTGKAFHLREANEALFLRSLTSHLVAKG